MPTLLFLIFVEGCKILGLTSHIRAYNLCYISLSLLDEREDTDVLQVIHMKYGVTVEDPHIEQFKVRNIVKHHSGHWTAKILF